MKPASTIIVLNLLVSSIQAQQTETYYTKLIAQKSGSKEEYRLFDNTRVDIVTDEYAIEIDWSHKSLKWAEAVGQSLYYASVTNLKPGIILLVPEDMDETSRRNIYKCYIACEGRIRVWVMTTKQVEKVKKINLMRN